jgi:5-methyltetrahydropteroyltriglutamate--homocysteine methyltransferase
MIIDDIGSFPLPKDVHRDDFIKEYAGVREAYAEAGEIVEDSIFYRAVASSLGCKIESGIDVVNYPQHYDMHKQFLEPIESHQPEPFLIDEKYAVIPELYVVEKEAVKYFEETGERLELKVCATGPIELYTKTDFGYHVYDEILLNLAKSVNAFLRNSVLDTKHVVTSVAAIDEPSLGFIDLLNVDDDTLVKALDESVKSLDATVQIHLHTPKASKFPLATDNIDVLTGEFAATPKNMDYITKKDLETHDKFLRAGITRTDVDHILAAYLDKGVQPEYEQLVDTVDSIEKTFNKAKERFGDRMTFVGPDCGLGSWPSQEVAQLLLKRTVEAVK